MSNNLVRDILTIRDIKDGINEEILDLDLRDFVDNLTSQFMELRYVYKYAYTYKYIYIYINIYIYTYIYIYTFIYIHIYVYYIYT
jgi:hypothetical protein